MSSRILPPREMGAARPLALRQMHGGIAEHSAAAPAAPDPALMLERVRSEYEQKLRDARAAGLREGEERVRAVAAAEVDAAVNRMAVAVTELAGMRARLRREAEADLIRLAVAIARRILHRELAVDPDALRGLVLSALEKLQTQEVSRVRVHPDHAALLRASVEAMAGHRPPEVVADASCESGTLVFETTRGNLDVSVETQLEEIERGLTDRLRRSG